MVMDDRLDILMEPQYNGTSNSVFVAGSLLVLSWTGFFVLFSISMTSDRRDLRVSDFQKYGWPGMIGAAGLFCHAVFMIFVYKYKRVQHIHTYKYNNLCSKPLLFSMISITCMKWNKDITKPRVTF